MEELRKDMQIIRESQIRMEEDIRYHIKRTDLLEKKLDPIHNVYISARQLLLLLITSSGVVVAINEIISILIKK